MMTSSDNEGRLSILIITVDEPYYIPKFLEGVVSADDIEVVGITTMPPTLGTQGTISFALSMLRSFGPVVFAKHALFYGKYKLLDVVSRFTGMERVYSPKYLASRQDIEYRHVEDVNSEDYLSYARSLSPDVIVSVAATQKFGTDLLSVPDNRAINIHSSLLPEYRGVSPSFWALLNDEDESGITVHEMAEELDAGSIIRQEPIPIYEDDTLHSLNTRVAEEGSSILLEGLRDIRADNVESEPIDTEVGSYYSMPDRGDVRKFRRRGNRFY